MKRKGKKGSSLVMVVFVTAIIFTVGTVMLALVQTDYKARIQRSQSIKNLYAADSGLNLVNNVIRKQSEAAMVIASKHVKEDFNNDTYKFFESDAVIDKDKYNIVNNRFKAYFIKALTTSGVSPNTSLIDVNSDEANWKTSQSLCYAVKSLQYNYCTSTTDMSTVNVIKDLPIKSIYNDPSTDASEGKSAKLTIDGINVKSLSDDEFKDINHLTTDDKKNYIVIKVTSKFETTTNGGKKKSPKVITTKFTVNAPDYDQMLTASVESVELYKYLFLRAITCDGNIVYNPVVKKDSYSESDPGVTINGGVWNKGNLEDNDDETKKYDSGIIINGGKFKVQGLNDKYTTNMPKDIDKSDTENCEGGVYSNGSISLIGNCDVELPSVFARNVYSGSNTNHTGDAEGKNIKLSVNGDVVTNNDLVINSTNTEYNISGSYYGINDIVGNQDDTSNSDKYTSDTRRSSSIIINKNDNKNKLNIAGEAYINGVAFLSLGKKNGVGKPYYYETGESVSVQDNYQAYTEVLPGDNEAELQYYDAYTLIGGSVSDKAKHFISFYENNDKAKNGEVSIGSTIYALGATVNNKNDNDGNYNTEVGKEQSIQSQKGYDTVKQKKNEFAYKVMLMYPKTNPYNVNDDYSNEYSKYDVSTSVLGGNNATPIIDFNKYIDDCNANHKTVVNPLVTGKDESKIFKSKYYKTIYDCSENDAIFVTNGGVYVNDPTDKNNLLIEPTKSGSINAVIIAKGNVIFDSTKGDIDYHGTIVSGGDVTMGGKNNIEITFDKKNVQYALVQQQTVYPAIKDSYFITGQQDGFGQASTILNTENDYVPTYDSKYLKDGIWKLGGNNVSF